MTRCIVRRAHSVAVPLALGLMVHAAPLRAQWRGEASVAARAGQSRGDATQPGAGAAGMAIAASSAWEIARRNALRLELVGAAGHEGIADRSGGDARTVLRLSWSRDGRAGLMFEGGSVLAWRTATDNASSVAPADSSLALRDRQSRTGQAPPSRVGGAVTALSGWARVGRVMLGASARATTAGSRTDAFLQEHVTMVDSFDVRARFDSILGRVVTDSVHLGQMARHTWTEEERRRRMVYSDLSLDATTSAGPIAFALAGGVRHATLEGRGEGWGSARATFTLQEGLGLTLQAARLANDRLRALPARSELQLGVVLRPRARSAIPVALPTAAATTARSFAVRSESDGRVTLVVRAPGAHAVELMGDFTAWRVVALERGRGGAWEVTLELARGMHQVNLRVDGGPWLPPPGLGVGDDGFGGTFGLLVL